MANLKKRILLGSVSEKDQELGKTAMMRRKDIFLMFFEALFSSSFCDSSLVLVVPKGDDDQVV